MSVVLSIDLGTSGCRSAIFNEKLELLCSHSVEYPLIVCSQTHIEQDARLWWSSVKDTIRSVTGKMPEAAKQIRSIAISSQGISFVPINRDGDVLANAVSWLDSDSVREEQYLSEKYGERELYNRTGKRLSALYTLPKLIRFKKNEPEIYAGTWKLLLPLDYIQYKLCGRCVTDHTMAAGTMYYDIEKREWAEDILCENGIDHDLLPELEYAGKPAEVILPQVADELGLPHDVVIMVGAQDQKCAAYGAGASDSVATASLGTGCCITQLANRFVSDTHMRIPCFSYITPDYWDFEGVINTAAASYMWFKEKFADDMSMREIDELAAASAAPSEVMFYPYLSGASSPYWGSGTGTFTGLSLMSDKGSMARAILEGIAFHIRSNLDVMQTLCGEAKELRLFGGGSKSDLWCQIIAHVTDKAVVRLASSQTALAGAAMLAFTGLGNTDIRPLRPAETFYPEADCVEKYDRSYMKYETTRNKFFTYM